MTDASLQDLACELVDVNFAYPDGDAGLHSVTVRVERGERFAILGPNGSGKTTLLRLMAGLLRATSGSSTIAGHDSTKAERRRFARDVAMVSPQSDLGFPYTVIEVVLMGRAPHVAGSQLETEEDLNTARRALDETDVSHLETRIFDTLSSGERQRVAVARAIAQQPTVLLLDEPAAFLDIKQQTLLYDRLTELNRSRGTTVISVLHDLNLAALYFDRVAFMKKGRLLHVGTPREAITYQNIREVFETDVYVDANTVTGTLNVLPLPTTSRSS